jgi:serine/threonine-protein kinase HipA
MRKANVFYQEHVAGVLSETIEGYQFDYNPEYVENTAMPSISLTLPKRRESYCSKTMFPFFDGLIPEGWLLMEVERNWKINQRDRMGLLLHTCRDCIGAVSIVSMEDIP